MRGELLHSNKDQGGLLRGSTRAQGILTEGRPETLIERMRRFISCQEWGSFHSADSAGFLLKLDQNRLWPEPQVRDRKETRESDSSLIKGASSCSSPAQNTQVRASHTRCAPSRASRAHLPLLDCPSQPASASPSHPGLPHGPSMPSCPPLPPPLS